jgi:hypothetical protein
MIEALRQHKPTRGSRRTTLAGGGFVPQQLRIVYRPEQIESRRRWPGHWVGDFIKGAFSRSWVGTLVERETRFVVLCRMDGCTAEDALEGFTRQMKKLPAFLRESLTYDRGTEMTCHVELAKRLNPLISGLPIRTRLGSAAATRIPTACCVSFCPRAWPFQHAGPIDGCRNQTVETAPQGGGLKNRVQRQNRHPANPQRSKVFQRVLQ